MENIIEEESKRRGRKTKNQSKEVVINKEQTKFFVDLSHEKKILDLIFSFLVKCNQKSYGRIITFKDLCLYSLSRLTEKDISKVQEMSLTQMEKVQRALDDFNEKTGQKLELGEFLVKKLGIN